MFSRNEAHNVISKLQGEFHLMASLLYGSGLRLSECLQLRVKDIDFDLREILVRGGKGDSDRRTILPVSLKQQISRQIEKARIRLEENLQMNQKNWPGNISFQQGNLPLIHVQDR